MSATIDIQDPKKAHYSADWARIAPNGDPLWLKQLRIQGVHLFRDTELPTTRMEEWRKTNISAIINTPYRNPPVLDTRKPDRETVAPFLFAGTEAIELVFVNGHYCEDMSRLQRIPEGVAAGSLRQAAQGPLDRVVEKHLGNYLKARNAYTALNTAFLLDGAFVYIPKNTRVEKPIHIVFLSTAGQEPSVAHPRLLVVLEQGSQASVAVSYTSPAGEHNYLNNVVEEIALGPEARLDFCRVVEEQAQGSHLATTEVRLERGGRFNAFVAALNGNIVRNQLCAELAGEGAECLLNGLYLNDGRRLTDTFFSVVHARPHGLSRINGKGILDGDSKAVFLGKVHVHPDAQKTDSRQLNNNLLLSEHATVETKPQLEIFADDVKCTHGATVGAPPQEVLFYFRSRGISEAAARGMLTCGFAQEIIKEAPVLAVREHLSAYVNAKYAPPEAR